MRGKTRSVEKEGEVVLQAPEPRLLCRPTKTPVCVDSMAWHIRSTEVESFSRYQCTVYTDTTKAQECRTYWISGVTRGCQELSVIETEVSLTGDRWQKHPTVTGPDAPCILGINYLRKRYFKI